jgi:hypothetical protein
VTLTLLVQTLRSDFLGYSYILCGKVVLTCYGTRSGSRAKRYQRVNRQERYVMTGDARTARRWKERWGRGSSCSLFLHTYLLGSSTCINGSSQFNRRHCRAGRYVQAKDASKVVRLGRGRGRGFDSRRHTNRRQQEKAPSRRQEAS